MTNNILNQLKSTGDDTVTKFIEKIFEEVKDCQRVMEENFNKALCLTAKEEKDLKKSY